MNSADDASQWNPIIWATVAEDERHEHNSAPPSGATTNVSSDVTDLRQRLQTEQIFMLCRLSRSSMTGAIGAALFVAFLLHQEHSLRKVLAWIALVVAITVVRARYQHRLLDGEVAVEARVVRRVLLLIAVYGAIWSLPSTWLLPSQSDSQVVLGLILIGLSANGLISLAPLPLAYGAFIAPMLIPIALMYFWMGNSYATSAIGIVAYFAAMLVGGRRLTQNTEALLRLQLENAALAERLQREKEGVERANRDLEMQVTRRERIEAELRVAKGEAEGANRAKNQFLANMSHELRTPLNGVLGMSELLQRALANVAASQKLLKYAQTIRASGERLLRLIDDILDMSRIEAGAMRFEQRAFDPRRLIAETVEAFAEESAKKNIAVTASVAPSVPARLIGDPSRLRQVLTNLVANAIKFTDVGSIEIALAPADSVDDSSARRTFRWSVSDTGIGIAPQARGMLFQPFSQVDDSSTRRHGGTGLGLAICRQIVTALDGRIDLDSAPGQGSKFWFCVPLTTGSATEAVDDAENASPLPVLRGRVLVAEDNATNSDLIVEMLQLGGCDVVTVTNGVDALDKLAHEIFDAILMDWHMPILDGLAATREIRARERAHGGKRIPIIALTASVLPGDREACAQAGMDDFIAKPFTYQNLVTVMAKWLTTGK